LLNNKLRQLYSYHQVQPCPVKCMM
jgi:hypothetical protein